MAAKKRAAANGRGKNGVDHRIESVTIQGFKSIVKQTIELGRLNVFVGANGSGKTSVLEAIGLLGAAAGGTVSDVELLQRGVRAGAPARHMTALKDYPTKSPRIELEARTGSGARYSVRLTSGRSIAWEFTREQLLDGDKELLRRRHSQGFALGQGDQPQGFLDVDPRAGLVGSALPFRPPGAPSTLIATLRDFVIYDPQTPTLRGRVEDPYPREPLGLQGGGLALAARSALFDARKITPEEIFGLVDWAQSAMPGRPRSEVSPQAQTVEDVLLFADKYMRPESSLVPAPEASEGALYVFFALTALLHESAPPLFAIEHIDNALHPRVARALVRIMAEHVKKAKRQVLLTTHNPLVLDGLALGDDDIRLFTVDRTTAGHTVVSRVEYSDALAKAEKSGRTLSQLWVSGSLGGTPEIW
jgi:predicted ATPase